MVLFTLNKYFEKIHKTVNISKTVRDIKKTNRKISPDSTPCRFWAFPIKCIYFYVCRTLNTRATKFDDDVIKCLHVNNSKTVIVIKTKPTYYVFVDILLINPIVISQLCQFLEKSYFPTPSSSELLENGKRYQKNKSKNLPRQHPLSILGISYQVYILLCVPDLKYPSYQI